MRFFREVNLSLRRIYLNVRLISCPLRSKEDRGKSSTAIGKKKQKKLKQPEQVIEIAMDG